MTAQDTYAALRTDEIRRPGFTWCSVTKEHAHGDHWDRIDFIFAGKVQPNTQSLHNSTWRIARAIVVGESAHEADEMVAPWPSDHRAVLAELRLTHKLNLL